MGTAVTGILAALLLTSTLALPPKRLRRNTAADTSNFVGEGTNDLATAILQGYVDTESNLAFSPLGYAALLAIMAEGARGDTKEQLDNALHLPKDPQVTRIAYNTVLKRLKVKDSVNHPEFRNWFYVYKNFTVESDYKTIIQEYYLTELRDVDRFDSDTVNKEVQSTNTSEPTESVTVQEENNKEIKPDKTEDAVKVNDSVVPEKLTNDSMTPENSAVDSMNPEKSVDESVIPEKLEGSSVSETTEVTVVSDKTTDDDNITEKIEDPMPSAESEEIMQVSDGEDLTKPSKNGPLKIVFPIPFPEKLKLRKMYDDREASSSGAVMTMQEEMLGNKGEEGEATSEKKSEKTEEMKDDKTEAENKDKIKETGSMNEEMEIPNDEMKEGDGVGIKNDQIKEDNTMEVMKEEKKDKMEGMKDDKKETMENDKLEATKDDKLQAMKDKEMEAMKDENVEEMKEEMISDKEKENDKKDSMSDGITDEITKDNIKTEEVVMEDKDKKNEDMITGVMMKEEMKVDTEKDTTSSMGRKARHLDLGRLSRGYLQTDDVSSSLSGNNIVRKDTKSETISQMVVFNGLFFKGTWTTPFVRQKEDSFYKSASEKSTVTMMNTKGNFSAGNVPELDSVAIELPYKGGRYSLLLLIPNSRTGLSQLTSDLAGYSLKNVQKHLQFQEVEVSLPAFEIQTITKPIEALKKFGVTDVFSKEKADLSGISKDSGLFVGELVQQVTVKVDNGSSDYIYITAESISTRSEVFKIAADRPFLYFVRDTEGNLIVVAGKVTDPSRPIADP